MIRLRLSLLLPLFLLPVTIAAQGTVLLVIGSDTGIWEGLDVTKYHCTISPTLYTDATRNAARVMDPAFRGAMTDYFGTPMKLTWWMMAGNMFRLSTNTDVPTPSTMPIYLMKRYEGEGLRRWGDELTFHYHTWYWSDENGDGIWYWNQAPSFPFVAADFDQTLAEMLIEEDLFPVSFRSGWHAMDNPWQRRLNEILPFSMHNDYPAVRSDPTEPVDNVYDWSRSPSSYIPFHPSTTDYRVPGDGSGWNLRSRYMSVADSSFMAGIFAAAEKGVDQVVCLWAHLPETDFLDNLQKVNRSAHAASKKYPTVPYRYCTAVEAMQRWRRSSDTTKPTISLSEYREGDAAGWTVEVNEPIFQPSPIFAVKDRYEEHRLIPLTQIAPGKWRTSQTLLRADLAGIAVAAIDTSGNLATLHQRFLQEDIFIDNGDPGYQESSGKWSTVTLKGWGASFRSAPVTATDSAKVRWNATVTTAGKYSIFLRMPAASVLSGKIHITGVNGSTFIDSLFVGSPALADRWLYLQTTDLDPGFPVTIEMTSRASGAQTLTADVLRITPLVREKWVSGPEQVDAGDFIVREERTIQVTIQNSGYAPARLLSASTASGKGAIAGAFARPVPGMSSLELQILQTPEQAGAFLDTLIVTTDDPRHPVLRTRLTGRVREYFVTADNGDSAAYREYGTWAYSTASGFNGSSRYAFPQEANFARYNVHLKKGGLYQISGIVPTTVNATDRAKYLLRVSGIPRDSVFINQNQGSGGWVELMKTDVSAHTDVSVTVSDAMSPVISGRVLRADALEFQWISESGATAVIDDHSLPQTTALLQNYPNPFNPGTAISYQLSAVSVVKLRVFDVLGRELGTIVNELQKPGSYIARWDASGLPSGVYYYQLEAVPQGDASERFVDVKKMLLLR